MCLLLDLKPSEINFCMCKKLIFKDFELSWSFPKRPLFFLPRIIGKNRWDWNSRLLPEGLQWRHSAVEWNHQKWTFSTAKSSFLIISSSACHVLSAETYTATHHLRDATLHIAAQLLVGLKPLETNFFNGKKLIFKDFEFSLSCRRRPFLRFPITISLLLQSRKVAF